MKRAAQGYSLVELLITVGLLLMLAGYSISNYQDAATRARAARVSSEFRAFQLAIEAYNADQNQPPRMAHRRFYNDPVFDSIDQIGVNGVPSKAFTTPIAYMSKGNIIDPFMVSRSEAPLDEQFYSYQVLGAYVEQNPRSAFWPEARRFYGEWRLISVGPDAHFDHNFSNSAQLPYDPTNGLVSAGNIFWSPRGGTSGLPPMPQLLGLH